MKTNLFRIDYEQSLFFFRFSEGSARARSCLFRLPPSATRVVEYGLQRGALLALSISPSPFQVFSLTSLMLATFNLAV